VNGNQQQLKPKVGYFSRATSRCLFYMDGMMAANTYSFLSTKILLKC